MAADGRFAPRANGIDSPRVARQYCASLGTERRYDPGGQVMIEEEVAMRLQTGLLLLAGVLIVLVVSACGSSSSSQRSTGSSSSNTTSTGSASSSPTSTGSSSASASSDGTPVDSPAMRSELEQELRGTAGVKPPEAKKIVDCIIAKLSAAGITTDGEAASHEGELTNFSEACAEKVVAAGG
jgi:hypothetical protein